VWGTYGRFAFAVLRSSNSEGLRIQNSNARLFLGRFAPMASRFPMASSNDHDLRDPGSVNLAGVRILVVEDSWPLAEALKSLLLSLGADVAGPVATTADAERLISEQNPDVAIVDINLRGGELAHGLIDSLNVHGIRVIVTSGYTDVALAPGKAAAILQKPIMEAELIAALRPVSARKAAE
jgi:CheY-like chemotaxis protein